MQTESSQNLLHMPLLRSAGGVRWGSQAKTGLVYSNSKERVLINIAEVLSKECTRGTPAQGVAVRMLIPRATGRIISGTYIYL